MAKNKKQEKISITIEECKMCINGASTSLGLACQCRCKNINCPTSYCLCEEIVRRGESCNYWRLKK